MNSDISVTATSLWFLPVETRVPLRFGAETLTHVTCARVRITVMREDGSLGEGWGETPLSVQWVWPGGLDYHFRLEKLKEFCRCLAKLWPGFTTRGHAMEVGYDFLELIVRPHWLAMQQGVEESKRMPWLAALVCASAFDIAVHDAFGVVNGVPVYQTYDARWMNRDLSYYLTPAKDRTDLTFAGEFPSRWFRPQRSDELMAWHLVGGADALDEGDLSGDEPTDGYPVTLEDWLKRDGLRALKIKLRGYDSDWDWNRLVKIGRMAEKSGVLWITADFNCTVSDPAYVTAILDRLRDDAPGLFAKLLYVEQPFPYELEENRLPVQAVSSRKPLFLDESAHDWQNVRLGRELGWTGVALKTCKTQTGAILSACWALAHGMTLMVQDLTNPMLAQISHCQLAAHLPTIAGVETNGMQFYPEASLAEAVVHPGVYRRTNGCVTLATIRGNGMGYRIAEIKRDLPTPE